MNEDFVSFELAKMLKEKGFREKCLAYYDAEDNVGLLYNTQYSDELLPCQYTELLASYNSGEGEAHLDNSDNCIDAPTIPQVLKWLREEKKIHVCSSLHGEKGYSLHWNFVIYRTKDSSVIYTNMKPNYGKYEFAALAGIEYVLDNLI